MLAVYFAQKAFVISESRLLAVRRSANDSHHPLRWEVPGGRLEAGEDLDQHLIREVFEEAGVQIAPGEPFFVWKWNIKSATADSPDTIVAIARVCLAVTTTVNDTGRVDGDNLDLIEWIPVAKVREYDWIPNMVPVLDAFLTRIKVAHERGAGIR